MTIGPREYQARSVNDLLLIPLAITYGIALIIFVYVAGYSWYLGGPAVNQGLPWLYSSAVVSGASLFVLSYVYHARRHKGISPAQRLLLALFDVATFFCGATLIMWGLVLPILRPISATGFQLYLFNQESLALSLYTGLVLCSLVVVFRIALQFLIVRSVSTVMITKTPNPPMMERAESKEKGKAIEDSLSLIRSEIAMLRAEISSLGSTKIGRTTRSEFTLGENSSWSSIANPEPMPFAISQASPRPVSPPVGEQIKTENLAMNTEIQDDDAPPLLEYEPTISEIQLPDSAKNNPWASVLSRRQGRAVLPEFTPEIREPIPVATPNSGPVTASETDSLMAANSDLPVNSEPAPLVTAPPILELAEEHTPVVVEPAPVAPAEPDPVISVNPILLASSELYLPGSSDPNLHKVVNPEPPVAFESIPAAESAPIPVTENAPPIIVDAVPQEVVYPDPTTAAGTITGEPAPSIAPDPFPQEALNPVALLAPPPFDSASEIAGKRNTIRIKIKKTRKGKTTRAAKSKPSPGNSPPTTDGK